MLLCSPFLGGISCVCSARSAWTLARHSNPRDRSIALYVHGLFQTPEIFCCILLRIFIVCPESGMNESEGTLSKRPLWKPWRTLRMQGTKGGTVSPIASKGSKATPQTAMTFSHRQKWVNRSPESWGLTHGLCCADGHQDKESGGTPVMLLLFCSLV